SGSSLRSRSLRFLSGRVFFFARLFVARLFVAVIEAFTFVELDDSVGKGDDFLAQLGGLDQREFGTKAQGAFCRVLFKLKSDSNERRALGVDRADFLDARESSGVSEHWKDRFASEEDRLEPRKTRLEFFGRAIPKGREVKPRRAFEGLIGQ